MDLVYIIADCTYRPRTIIVFLPRIETLRHACDNIHQAPDLLAQETGNEAITHPPHHPPCHSPHHPPHHPPNMPPTSSPTQHATDLITHLVNRLHPEPAVLAGACLVGGLHRAVGKDAHVLAGVLARLERDVASCSACQISNSILMYAESAHT